MSQCYICGGAVRDTLLGLIPKDVDYAWTNTTPEFLIEKGMRQVGADFPVFLDHNGDQHALARIERKTGVGYNGFECVFDQSVTIEQDLERRDLTINSMAVKLENWDKFVATKDTSLVIDPFDGILHLEEKKLVHTSDAFAEDPIRVLRTARFAARYGFTVGIGTLMLMESIVHELNNVPSERIWAEISKGLMEQHPEQLMLVLESCNAFLVDILQPFSIYSIPALQKCDDSIPLECRFVYIAFALQPDEYTKLSIPNDCRKLNELYLNVKSDIFGYTNLNSQQKLEFFKSIRAFNDTTNLELLFKTIYLNWSWSTYLTLNISELIISDLNKLKQIDIGELTKDIKDVKQIQQIIKSARLLALQN